MIYNLIKNCRSYRSFDSARKISRKTLVSFVESARVAASAANLQKLWYSLFTDKIDCDRIFETLKFAGYLSVWNGLSESERPTTYIVISSDGDIDILTAMDLGIAFGYPSETVIIVDSVDFNIKYYRDEMDRHVVPKLSLETLVIN